MSQEFIAKGPKIVLAPLGRSASFFKDMKDLIKARELLVALLRRELAGRYKASVLGIGWTLIRPLVMLFIYGVVVGQFLGAARSVEQFGLFIFVGLVFWNLLSESINAGSTSLTANGQLLKKVWFPREVLPLSSFAVAVVHFFFQFLVLILGYGVYGSWPNPENLLFLIPTLLIAFPVAFGIGLITSVLNVRFRDTQYVVEVGILILFWLSPILYPWSFAHEFLATLPGGQILQQIYLANPFGLVAMAAQQALWPPITTASGIQYAFFDSVFATRLWLTVLASWIFLYFSQRLFARFSGTVASEL
jgi:ABC-2 type transport system permease protein